jgi:hypothetical protein
MTDAKTAAWGILERAPEDLTICIDCYYDEEDEDEDEGQDEDEDEEEY